MKIRFVILFFVLAGVSSCIKQTVYPVEPHIEFKSVAYEFIKSGSIDTITFSFTDGDGDIGVKQSTDDTADLCGLTKGDSACLHASEFNIFLVDMRDSCVLPFASAYVEPQGRFKSISGDMVVITTVNSKKCFPTPSAGCPKDTLVYTIYLRDLAGHLSNAVKSVPIIVDGE